MNTSAWSPIDSYKNETPFAVLFSSALAKDPEFPGLPIVVVPSSEVSRVVSDSKVVNGFYDFAVGVDGFDSANWKSLDDTLPDNENEFVLLKHTGEGDEAGNRVTASNPFYVRSGNALKEGAEKWAKVPYPLPA